jgi:hypothetical protein
MSEIGLQEAGAFLKTAGETIRALVKLSREQKAKLDELEKNARVEQIARVMEDKGLSPDLTFEEKLAALSQADDLDVQEAAVKMATPQGFYLGEPGEQPGSGMDALTHFIVNGEDPTE